MAIVTLLPSKISMSTKVVTSTKKSLEVKLDLKGKKVEVFFHPNNAIATISLNDYYWQYLGQTFRLKNFGELIREVTDNLFAGYKPGKFAKCGRPDVPLKFFRNKYIKLVSKLLSPELHKLLLLVNKRYLKLENALTRAFGFKRGLMELNIFFSKDFIKSKNYKAVLKYNVAIYAIYQSQDINCDWKRYFCYKKKLTKDYLLTIKSIKYPIQLRLLDAIRKQPIPKALTNRTELFWYIANVNSFSFYANQKYLPIVLDSTAKDIKWAAKKLRECGYKFDLRSYDNFTDFIDTIFTFKTNCNISTLRELVTNIFDKRIKKILREVNVSTLKTKLSNPFDLSKYGWQPVKTAKELISNSRMIDINSNCFYFKNKNKLLHFYVRFYKNQLSIESMHSGITYKNKELKDIRKNIEAQLQLHAKSLFVT